MNKKIIIGARGSKLSLSYAEIVKKLFLSASYQKIEIEIKTIKTSGDIFHDKKSNSNHKSATHFLCFFYHIKFYNRTNSISILVWRF